MASEDVMACQELWLKTMSLRVLALYEGKRLKELRPLLQDTKDAALRLPAKQFAVWALITIDVGLGEMGKSAIEKYMANLLQMNNYQEHDASLASGTNRPLDDLSLLGGVYAVEVLGKADKNPDAAKKWVEEVEFLVPDHKTDLLRQLDSIEASLRIPEEQRDDNLVDERKLESEKSATVKLFGQKCKIQWLPTWNDAKNWATSKINTLLEGENLMEDAKNYKDLVSGLAMGALGALVVYGVFTNRRAIGRSLRVFIGNATESFADVALSALKTEL